MGDAFSVAIAHPLWAVTLVLFRMICASAGVDRSLPEAAADVGVLAEVAMLLIGTGVCVLLTFITSVNEFLMTLLFGSADVKTLPVASRRPGVCSHPSILWFGARAVNSGRLVERM